MARDIPVFDLIRDKRRPVGYIAAGTLVNIIRIGGRAYYLHVVPIADELYGWPHYTQSRIEVADNNALARHYEHQAKPRPWPQEERMEEHAWAVNIPVFDWEGNFEQWSHEELLEMRIGKRWFKFYRFGDSHMVGYFPNNGRAYDREAILTAFYERGDLTKHDREKSDVEEIAQDSVTYADIKAKRDKAAADLADRKRSPPRVPAFNHDGKFRAWVHSSNGRIMPTALVSEGEDDGELLLFVHATFRGWFDKNSVPDEVLMGYFPASVFGTDKARSILIDFKAQQDAKRKINMINREDVDAFKLIVNSHPDGNLLDSYQEIAGSSAIYPGKGESTGLGYVALKLNGEAGEFAEHMGKAMRDDSYGIGNTPLTPDRREKLIKELGDILWYVQAGARELGVSMSTVAIVNLEKLCDRGERDQLRGSGDDR